MSLHVFLLFFCWSRNEEEVVCGRFCSITIEDSVIIFHPLRTVYRIANLKFKICFKVQIKFLHWNCEIAYESLNCAVKWQNHKNTCLFKCFQHIQQFHYLTHLKYLKPEFIWRERNDRFYNLSILNRFFKQFYVLCFIASKRI